MKCKAEKEPRSPKVFDTWAVMVTAISLRSATSYSIQINSKHLLLTYSFFGATTLVNSLSWMVATSVERPTGTSSLRALASTSPISTPPWWWNRMVSA